MPFARMLAGFALLLSLADAFADGAVRVRIIGLNDFHGTLNSPGNASNSVGGPSVPTGGIDALAAHVAWLAAGNPNHVVVAAGDLTGASPLASALFHDEGAIETLNRLGLDFSSVGNHEFDYGTDELLRKQNGGCHPSGTNTCEGAAVGTPVPFEGARFQYLAANVVVTATGQTLLPAYGIRTFGGVRIGFIGMTLAGTPGIVTPTGVAGLTFMDEADTVNALVPKLVALGVKAIVVLIHQGGFQGSTPPNSIDDCAAALGDPVISPIKGIVARLDDAVDLVISGHTHVAYNCALPNKAGRNVPVTQAGAFGRVLTNADLTLDADTGKVTGISIHNILVDRTNTAVAPFANAQIKAIVAGYDALVAPLANRVIGTIAAPAGHDASPAGEMAAGDLIADAQLAATAAASAGSAQIALVNAGGVRNPGFDPAGATYPHDVTYNEAFTVQPFGNSLVTSTLTAQQLKDVLEQQFAGCKGQTADRIMQVSSTLRYAWSASAAACSKVRSVVYAPAGGSPITIVDNTGKVLDPAATYRVTVNNFTATGGDGFSVLRNGLDPLGGPQDIDALVAYMSRFKAPNPPYDPTPHGGRITRMP